MAELSGCAAAVVLFALGAAVDVRAQNPLVTVPLDSGAVIRLHLRDGVTEGGKLIAPFGPESTQFSYCRWPALPCSVGGSGHLRRPTADVFRIDVHRGARAPRGAVVGGLVGVALGLVYIEALRYSSETPLESGDRVRVVSASTALCAVFGATIGGLFDRWSRAP